MAFPSPDGICSTLVSLGGVDLLLLAIREHGQSPKVGDDRYARQSLPTRPAPLTPDGTTVPVWCRCSLPASRPSSRCWATRTSSSGCVQSLASPG